MLLIQESGVHAARERLTVLRARLRRQLYHLLEARGRSVPTEVAYGLLSQRSQLDPLRNPLPGRIIDDAEVRDSATLDLVSSLRHRLLSIPDEAGIPEGVLDPHEVVDDV